MSQLSKPTSGSANDSNQVNNHSTVTATVTSKSFKGRAGADSTAPAAGRAQTAGGSIESLSVACKEGVVKLRAFQYRSSQVETRLKRNMYDTG